VTYPTDVPVMAHTDQYEYYGTLYPYYNVFFEYYHYYGTNYGSGWLSFEDDTSGTNTSDGTFTRTGDDIAWTYDRTSYGAFGHAIRNCTGAVITRSAETSDLTDGTSPTTMDDTLTNCATGEYFDTWTVALNASETVLVSVDSLTEANQFDPYIWLNDGSGCTGIIDDDAFDCASGLTGYCPSLTYTSSAAETITIYVNSVGSCFDTTGDIGNYQLRVKGGTGLTKTGDELRDKVIIDADGSGTITTL